MEMRRKRIVTTRHIPGWLHYMLVAPGPGALGVQKEVASTQFTVGSLVVS
jgi:hypothetical protein